MFHRVGDVQPVPLDAGRDERLVQQLARGPDERRPRLVLLIARLFTDEHHVGVRRARAEHSLVGVQVQVASLTTVRGFRQRVEITAGGHEIGGCHNQPVTRYRVDFTTCAKLNCQRSTMWKPMCCGT